MTTEHGWAPDRLRLVEENRQLQLQNTGILRFAQNDDVKQSTARTTTEADPYGMTNKKGNCNSNCKSKSKSNCNGNGNTNTNSSGKLHRQRQLQKQILVFVFVRSLLL